MAKAEISILVLLLVALLGSTEWQPLRFPKDYWNPSGWWWTKLIERRATWEEAWFICRLEGRHLASPGQTVNTEVFEIEQITHRDGIWTDWRGYPGKLYHSNYLGENMTAFLRRYVKSWYPRRALSTHRCLVSMPNHRVRDSHCMEELPFICGQWGQYWRFGNTACNSYDKEYQLAHTGYCYKLHRNGLEWQAALIKCRAEGGELLIVESYEEANVIHGILVKNQQRIKSGYGDGMAFVGLYYYHTHHKGRWVTIHGKNLRDTGFNEMGWYDGEPPHSCGGFYKGRLIALNCGIPYRFICKKNPRVPL